MTDEAWWYLARGGGLVAWALLTASVVWGLALTVRPLRAKSVQLVDMHRFLGGLSLAFLGLHLAGLLADEVVPFSWSDALVPMAAGWHPLVVAYGVVGAWVLVAVELTSLARRRVPLRVWRRTHHASFAVFVLATLHAFTAGTDVDHLAAMLLLVVGSMAVAFLTAARVTNA